jgi:chromosome segregation ATPase
MAESIVTTEAVLHAVLELRAEGVYPSGRKVRERIGGGSLNRVQEVLNQVLADNPVLERKMDPESLQPVYDAINDVLADLINKATSEVKHENYALVSTCKGVAAEKQSEMIRAESLTQELTAANAEIEKLKGQIAQLKRSLAEATQSLDESKDLEVRMKDWEQLKEETTQATKDAAKVEEMRETVERRFVELKGIMEKVSSSINSGIPQSKKTEGQPKTTLGKPKAAKPSVVA